MIKKSIFWIFFFLIILASGIFIFYSLKEKESSQERLISVSDLTKNPLFYLNKTVQIEGTVRLVGEYFGGFFLLEEKNFNVQVDPWVPLEFEPCSPDEDCPSLDIMGNYIDKKVRLIGVFREVEPSRETYTILSINGGYYLIEDIKNVSILS